MALSHHAASGGSLALHHIVAFGGWNSWQSIGIRQKAAAFGFCAGASARQLRRHACAKDEDEISRAPALRWCFRVKRLPPPAFGLLDPER